MTHPHVQHDSFIRVPRHIRMSGITVACDASCETCGSFIGARGLIQCDTFECATCDASSPLRLCVTLLVHTCDLSSVCVCTYIHCVTLLVHTCDLSSVCVCTYIHCVTSLVHTCDLCQSHVPQVSFTHVIHMSFACHTFMSFTCHCHAHVTVIRMSHLCPSTPLRVCVT